MDKNLIATLVNQVVNDRPELANQPRITRFYFDGDKKSVKNLVSTMKKNEASVESRSPGSLIILDTVVVSSAAIAEKVASFEALAVACGANLEGFEVAVDDSIIEHPRIPDFDKFHVPGSVLAYKLRDGRYGYFIYVGGTLNSGGWLFDFVDYISDGLSSDVQFIQSCPCLYRQPLAAVIDHKKVTLVGHVKIDYEKINSKGIFLRIAMGMESYEILMRDGVYSKDEFLPLDRELDALLDYVAKGRVFLLKNWGGMVTYSFTKTGRCRSREDYTPPQRDDRFEQSYIFCTLPRLEWVESRLLGENRDLVYLSDAVFR
ncbi:MAG: hypothetical protein Q8O37_16665 [Sulfuricellaceae bacterium]|nr:hypothetical protein [Sulfuricellaceae bacterium]